MKVGKYEIDERRTSELNLPELLVVSGEGDENHFFCILVPAKAFPACPDCGNPIVRNQGNMHREYLDVIWRRDDAALITIALEYRKNKCTATGCGRVYYPEFSFAGPYARTTRRLENAVVRMVLRGGLSYAEIANELEGRLSRQVIGQLFNRRVTELNENPGEDGAWYRELLEEGPFLFYRGMLNRGHRSP